VRTLAFLHAHVSCHSPKSLQTTVRLDLLYMYVTNIARASQNCRLKRILSDGGLVQPRRTTKTMNRMRRRSWVEATTRASPWQQGTTSGSTTLQRSKLQQCARARSPPHSARAARRRASCPRCNTIQTRGDTGAQRRRGRYAGQATLCT
jgi:hypothetical protein